MVRTSITAALLWAAAHSPAAAYLTQVSSTPGNDFDHCYNWCGTYLAFTCVVGAENHVFVVNSDGTGQRDLSAMLGGSDDGEADWRAGTDRLAFRRCPPGGDDEIMAVNADGTSPMIMGMNAGLYDGTPQWSPNGQKIAWRSERVAAGPYQLMVADANGGNVRQLTFLAGGDVNAGFRWSPNSRLIAYAADPGMQRDLYAVNVLNGQITQLTNSTVHGQTLDDLCWSPASDRIAYVANATPGSTSATDRELWVVQANGASRQRLTHNSVEDSLPRWSPAGDSIAFCSDPTGSNQEAMTVPPSGGTPANVSMLLGLDTDPVWNLDGSWLAWEGRDGGGQGEVYMARPDGSSRQNLSGSTADDIDPLWRPDGASVAFRSNRMSDYQLFSASTGGPTVLAFVLDALDLGTTPDGACRMGWRGRWVLPAAGLSLRRRCLDSRQWSPLHWQAAPGGLIGGGVTGSVVVPAGEVAEYRLEVHLLDGEIRPLATLCHGETRPVR